MEIKPLTTKHTPMFNPQLDVVNINHLNLEPHKLNLEGHTIFVNRNGGWNNAFKFEDYQQSISKETREFPID